MKKRNAVVLSAVLTLIPAALLLAVWGRLPERIITTWGVDGSITGTGSKLVLVWLVAMGPVLCAVLLAAPALDPRKESYQKFTKRYHGLCVAIMLFFSVVNCVVIWENVNPGTFSIGRLITGMLGLLFLWMGNVMPTFRHNYFVGIRTPWTLEDPLVWEKTHRLGGRLSFLCGLALLPMALLLPESWLAALTLPLVLVMSLVPCGMSYVWWKQGQGRE